MVVYMGSTIWLITFLLKKKWMWLLGIVIAIYFFVVPYQRNILLFFDDYDIAKKIFWDTAFLYHSIFSVILVFQGAVQLITSETQEIIYKNSSKIRRALFGVFGVYQVMAFPSYIWYLMVYTIDAILLCRLILTELASFLVFYIIVKITKQPLIGFLVLFGVLLFIYNLTLGV